MILIVYIKAGEHATYILVDNKYHIKDNKYMKYKKILQTFGTNVKTYRLEKGLSQEELAAKAKVHRTYIGGIERGERNVSLMNIARIADALNISIKDLI